jgi:uncharacterized oxidoreductase
MQDLTAEIFVAAGCSAEEGARIGRRLVMANLTGHDSHGVIRVPRYLQWMRDGTLVPGQTIEMVTKAESFAVVDGRHGFGQSVGEQAVELGIAMAKKNGVAIVALRNAGHLGRIGDWAEMAVEAGLVSIHFVNVAGSLLVAPFGGTERRMSTNPICIGVPLDDGPPLILDFATALVAEGKVLVAASGGKALPPGALIGPDGVPNSDPKTLYGEGDIHDPQGGRQGKGAIRAMGEHKGSGLALMCEMLAGALTGSGCAGPAKRPIANGMLSIYLSIEAFAGAGAGDGAGDGTGGHAFGAEARAYLDFFTSARPAEPDGEVLVPGEPERRRRAARLAEGLELPAQVWGDILAAAISVGLERAAIEARAAG